METLDNLPILDSAFALDLVDNDKDLYKILLESFLNDTSFEESELDRLICEKKLKEAAGYVHAVKGAGRQLGAKRLAAAGQRLEDALRGKTNEIDNVANLSKDVKTEYERALKEVQEYINRT